jgi:Ca-activated chloride channel homolog
LHRSDRVRLDPDDSIPTRLVSILPVKDRSLMESLIDRLTAGGGTEIGSALAMALVDVKAPTQAKSRAVVLLTDGQSPTAGLRETAEAMAKSNIVLSTIALGDGADRKTLASLAAIGSGRTYHVTDPAALVGVLKKETDLAVAKAR